MKNLYTLIILLIIFCHASLVHAEGTPPYTITPIYPENQTDSKGFFDLKVKPGDEQTLQLEIKNLESSSKVFTIESASAYTNPNGFLMYEKNYINNDSVIFDDLFLVENALTPEKNKITVPGNTTTKVSILLKVPNIQEGHLIGGIKVKYLNEGNAEKNENVNVQLNTQIVQVISVRIILPNSGQPSFTVGDVGLNEDKNELFMELKNNAPMMQYGVTGTFEVMNEDNNRIFSGEIGPFDMAPKTAIKHPKTWNDPNLGSGVFKVNLTLDINGETIIEKRLFEIKRSQLDEYQKNLPKTSSKANQSNDHNLMLIIGIAIAAVVLICLVMGIIMYKWIKKKNI